MSIKSTVPHGTTVQPSGRRHAKGLARDNRPLRDGRPIRRISLVSWLWAGLIAVALSYPAYAEDSWRPFSREPVDPIEQGKIDSANDPAESVNRDIFSANKYFDDHVLKPVARAYNEGLSSGVRQGIHNFTTNVGEPLVFANDILQGNVERALNTTQRFAINSTIGIAGIVDVAGSWGRPYHYADFGQTLGVWGVGPGPAVQIPLLGPSNLRDAFGLAATSAAGTFALQGAAGNAVSYTELGATGVNELDYRAKMLPNTEALEKSTKDLYEATRLIKAQMRVKLIEEGKAGAVSRNGGIAAEASHP